MRMTKKDFLKLSTKVKPIMEQVSWQDYKLKGLSATRYRWDCLWKSGFSIGKFCYYLNDDHIDTALRKIMQDVWGEC